jgi:hypothetical protein
MVLEPTEPADPQVVTTAVEYLGTLLSRDLVELDDFDALVARVLATRTRSDLEVVLAALPAVVTMTPPSRRLDHPLSFEARSGPMKLAGRWQVAAQTSVRTESGLVTVDLTDAEFDATVIDLDLEVKSGIIDVIVPRGLAGQLIEQTTGSGFIANALDSTAPLPGLPLLRVHARTGSGIIRLRHPKERRQRRWFRRRRR